MKGSAMTKRMNVVQAKEVEGRDKPYWLKVGSLFMKDGKINGIKLDALPLADSKGEVWLRCFEDDGGDKSSGGDSGGGNPWS